MDTPSCVNTFEAANGVGDKAAHKRSNTTQVSNVRRGSANLNTQLGQVYRRSS
jgi:hypothetical protein